MTDSTTLAPSPQRRRAMTALFGSVALASTGYIPAISVAPLVAEDILGSTTWTGLPGAFVVGGVALGATLLSRIMARWSRKVGLVTGFGLATSGIVVAAVAVMIGSFALFLAALLGYGLGVSARELARYAAGDLYPARSRGTAIAIVVWGGTVGSVLGPLLLAPAQHAAEKLGMAGLSGPYLLAGIAFLLGGSLLVVVFPPSPTRSPSSTDDPSEPARPLRVQLGLPRVQLALTALCVGHLVMVFIMSMTPVHIRHAGEGLGVVGLVFSSHTFGMFGLSPIAGRLSDAWGRLPVIFTGLSMLVVAGLLAAPSRGHDTGLLVVALFLLGLGWNFGFVAGSALLTESVRPAERLRLQGLADTLVWSTAAASSLVAGLVLSAIGYRGLSLVGATIAVAPIAVGLHLRTRLGRTPRSLG